MLNIIMVGVGIAIFIYSMTLFWRTYRLLEGKKTSLLWIILAFLVIFFFLGYVVFEYLLVTGEEIISYKILVSQIFFWGAVFVLICAKLFHSTFIVRKQMEEAILISNKQLRQEIIEREKAEEALKSSEKKYRSLVDNSLVGVYQANIEGHFLFVNEALVRMLEFESPEELIARGCFEIHKNPKDREVLIENLKKIGKVINFELDLLTKRGKTKHMLLSATLDGDVLSGMIQDITNRKLQEEALEWLRRQNELILNSAGEGIIGLDQEGEQTFVNPSAAKMLGYEVKELIGQKSHSILHHTKADGTPYPEEECPICAAYIDGEVHHVRDKIFWRKDGTSFSVAYTSSPVLEDGKPVGAVVTFWDITEHKQAEDALRQSENKYRTLIENLPQKIFLKDRNNVYISCNENYARDLGINPHEIAGKTDYDFFPKELADKYRADDKRIMESGKTEALEEKYIQDSTECFVQTVKIPVKNKEGNIVGVQAIFWDITERKQAEEELTKYREHLEKLIKARTAQLEAANRELEAFSYSVSHDLKAPLRAIAGFSSILVEDHYEELDDEGKRLLNIVKDNIQKMGDLIDDILALSRIGRKDIEHSKIDMDKLVKTVFDEIKATIPEREIQFDIKPLPPAYGDEGLIRQVFFNLLFNATKFTRFKENAIIEAVGYAEGTENVYYVKDNGVGFDMKYADKLFGAFQRLHSGEEFEGTGIGLATVQRIIHRHGGRIWAEGKVNEGATFYFTLPKKEELSLRKEKMFI